MDFFCKECASKPGWEFDDTKVIQRACGRCMLHRPCNDYSVRTGRAKIVNEPAPTPKEMVPQNLNVHAEATLPKPKGFTPTPQPVYPVAPPTSPGPMAGLSPGPGAKSEGDLAMEVLAATATDKTPRGVRLETVDKSGRKVTPVAKPAQQAPPPPQPPLELADEAPKK